MSNLMNKLTAIFCAFLIVTMPTYVFAQETEGLLPGKVTELKKGQHAPFSGVLLSPDAGARLFANLKFTEEECQLRLKKELDLSKIKFDAEILSLKLRLDVETTRSTSILEIKNERIQFLEKNWQPPAWYESGEFWFAIGIISGIALTAVAGYTIGQASK